MSHQSIKWSGSLKAKKKSELQNICRALEIQFKPEAIKLDLEQEILTALRAKSSLQSDPRFEGISYARNSSPSSPPGSGPTRSSSRRAAVIINKPTRPLSSSRRVERQESGEDDNQDDDEAQPRARRGSEGSKAASNPPSRPSSRRKSLVTTLDEQVQSLPSSAELVNASAELVNAIGTAGGEVENAISQASQKIESTKAIQFMKQTSSQAITKVGDASLGVAEVTLSGFQATQYALSSPWNIWALQILAELAYVFYSLVPMDHKMLRARSAPDYLVRLPAPLAAAIALLTSERFLRPLLEYIILTVLAPLTLASLVNFAPPPTSTRRGLLDRLSQLKPSPLTFSATRLAGLVLIHALFRPTARFGWPATSALESQDEFLNLGVVAYTCKNADLVGLESLQFVTSALGLTLGLHQLLSQAVSTSA
ncbi:hypothetical protein CROQUDRAFT_656142 [Cronartium quercuum f. sp. fusiforme G11]|uniref:Uncharacterized protein n=1 Tax=Cronartium quercuum f. sp. fusiforme G11 TaxID=708437 RepID=A0A9P6NNJ7_9BASI|nr:hypothetical protein CROQUDRAFT_656142 [Cronartium quercuum f. sp. fusiforme G11]